MLAGRGAPTHEFAHGIGGLYDNADDPADHAPHNDPTNPGHCTDGNEALCKDKTANGTGPCPDPLASRYLDCGGDDYFGFNPQPGNWLYDHFNAATDSRYLLAGSAVTPVTTYTPLPPQNLRAVDVQGTSIAFSFEQPGFYWGITRYELLQNTFIVATIPPTESTVTITGLQPNTQAPYRVRSVRETPTGTVYSALSQPITVTNNTSTTLAGAPVNGSVSVITNDARDPLNPADRLAIVPELANVIQDGQSIWQGARHDEDDPFSQRWRLQTATTTPTTTYTVRNFYSDLCLDVEGASQTNGARIIQRTCGTAARQRWTLVPVGTSTYQLRNANSNLCVQAASPTAVVAWRLVQAPCSTSQPTQRWTFNRFS